MTKIIPLALLSLALCACAEGRAIEARLGDDPGYPVVLATDDPELAAACELAASQSFERIVCVDESMSNAAILETDESADVQRLDGRIMRVTVAVDMSPEQWSFELLQLLVGSSG